MVLARGISAQISNFSLFLHLDTTETAAYAIAHDLELRRLLGRHSRRCDSSANFPNLLCEENEEIKRHMKNDLGKGRANSGFAPDLKKKEARQPNHSFHAKDTPNANRVGGRLWSQQPRPWQDTQGISFTPRHLRVDGSTRGKNERAKTLVKLVRAGAT